MRSFISIWVVCFGLGFAVFSTAQDKSTDNESSKQAPTEETAKSESKSQDTEIVDEPFNIDEFFKQGEENAKNGSSCQKSPDPIA